MADLGDLYGPSQAFSIERGHEGRHEGQCGEQFRTLLEEAKEG
jgi:hypothetical protein